MIEEARREIVWESVIPKLGPFWAFLLTCNVSIYMYLKQNDGSKMKPTDDRRDKKRNCLGIPSSQIPDQQTRNPPAANERSFILTLGPFLGSSFNKNFPKSVFTREVVLFPNWDLFGHLFYIYSISPKKVLEKNLFFVRSCLGLCLDKNSQKMCKKLIKEKAPHMITFFGNSFGLS